MSISTIAVPFSGSVEWERTITLPETAAVCRFHDSVQWRRSMVRSYVCPIAGRKPTEGSRIGMRGMRFELRKTVTLALLGRCDFRTRIRSLRVVFSLASLTRKSMLDRDSNARTPREDGPTRWRSRRLRERDSDREQQKRVRGMRFERMNTYVSGS